MHAVACCAGRRDIEEIVTFLQCWIVTLRVVSLSFGTAQA
jgi:hypothetical protein